MKNIMLNLLGKSANILAKDSFIQNLGWPEEDIIEDRMYWMYREKGISFDFDYDVGVTCLTAINLYAKETEDEYKEYKGEIPFGLSFSFSRA